MKHIDYASVALALLEGDDIAFNQAISSLSSPFSDKDLYELGYICVDKQNAYALPALFKDRDLRIGSTHRPYLNTSASRGNYDFLRTLIRLSEAPSIQSTSFLIDNAKSNGNERLFSLLLSELGSKDDFNLQLRALFNETREKKWDLINETLSFYPGKVDNEFITRQIQECFYDITVDVNQLGRLIGLDVATSRLLHNDSLNTDMIRMLNGTIQVDDELTSLNRKI